MGSAQLSVLNSVSNLGQPEWQSKPGARGNSSDNEYSGKPRLRRAGSSTASTTNLSVDEHDSFSASERSAQLCSFDSSSTTFSSLVSHAYESCDELSLVRWWPYSDSLAKTVLLQVNGLTEGFRTSGLPWDGPQCRSWMAGGSGILYCLPAFVSPTNSLEQFAWIIQAIFSVMADYIFIDQESIFHGIDRYYATFNVFATIVRASMKVDLSFVVVATTIPLFCFVMANRSKQRLDLQAWHYWHGAWHMTGAVVVSFVVHLLYSCQSFVSTLSVGATPIWGSFCKK